MFVGTGSDVGKSVINAGFCRVFSQDGYSPAPFKAQNMSLNSFATPEGLEIGRAQAVQAEACKIACSVEMNPILLKPTSNLSSQVVLNGKPIGNKSASEYFLGTDREMLFHEAISAYNRLDSKYNPIVIEGAGSISEINLWDKDITNMKVALETGAATYLIADIDRGGVFASVYGTISLLPPEQKELIKGIIINKFRGDIDLYKEGKKILEELTGKPVVGIVPYYRDIFIEQEDSVVIERKSSNIDKTKINILIVLLKHMSNFTDFDLLEQLPEVNLLYSCNPETIKEVDIVIIPGSKNSISDLLDLRKKGIADTILEEHHQGKPVYGICGGFQMMGMEILDPFHVEGDIDSVSGLGILPVTTSLSMEKKTEQCQFRFLDHDELCKGYEIHMGETKSESDSPVCIIGESSDGFFLNPKTWGSYIHGIFDNATVVEYILKQVLFGGEVKVDFQNLKDENYDKLAKLIRNSVDMDYIYKTLQND